MRILLIVSVLSMGLMTLNLLGILWLASRAGRSMNGKMMDARLEADDSNNARNLDKPVQELAFDC